MVDNPQFVKDPLYVTLTQMRVGVNDRDSKAGWSREKMPGFVMLQEIFVCITT
jgi:hypothetical protein